MNNYTVTFKDLKSVFDAETMDETVIYFEEDTEYNTDVFSEDDPQISKLKYIITYCLTETERHLFRQYVHDPNFHKMARRWKCTYTVARYKIIQIRDKIIELYNSDDLKKLC